MSCSTSLSELNAYIHFADINICSIDQTRRILVHDHIISNFQEL